MQLFFFALQAIQLDVMMWLIASPCKLHEHAEREMCYADDGCVSSRMRDAGVRLLLMVCKMSQLKQPSTPTLLLSLLMTYSSTLCIEATHKLSS